MSERAPQPIKEDSLRSVVLEHANPSRIGLPRHRVATVGTTQNGREYILLGSRLQVSDVIESRRSTIPTSGDIFRLGDSMLPDSLLDGFIEEMDLDSVRSFIGDGEILTSGPIPEPGQPTVVKNNDGIYAPLRVAEQQGWRISATQH